MNFKFSVEIWVKTRNAAQKQNPKWIFFTPNVCYQKTFIPQEKMHAQYFRHLYCQETEETKDKISFVSNLYINLLN